jgi:hypothetical protein
MHAGHQSLIKVLAGEHLQRNLPLPHLLRVEVASESHDPPRKDVKVFEHIALVIMYCYSCPNAWAWQRGPVFRVSEKEGCINITIT